MNKNANYLFCGHYRGAVGVNKAGRNAGMSVN
jgi:hypothetical protein